MAARNFLPRCTAFFNRIPIESVKICNSNAMHLGKKFLAAIFSAILYCPWVRDVHCTFIVMGLKIFSICLKNDCRITLEKDETPLVNRSVLGEIPQFDQYFSPFFGHLQL